MTLTLKPLCEQVMITGASSGIGRVTARMAATRGAKVVLIAHNEAAPAEIVGEIRANGGVAEFAVADVGDRIALSAAPLQHSIYTSAKLPPRRTLGLFRIAAAAGGTVIRARRSAKDAKAKRKV